ncbi:MAG: hypothetical protein M3198_09680 [Actinomycetota bacterium]|nr:hypothetical protein [Actinomycetota bacterium]
MNEKKHCPDCGRIMWFMEMPELGLLWHCTSCNQSVAAGGDRYRWQKPRVEVGRAKATERKYRSRQACPRCGRPLWTVDVQDYGTRQQCEDCRISIVSGSILEWKSTPSS